MPERIRAFVAVTRGVRRAADADAIENQKQRAHRLTRGIGVMEGWSNGFEDGASLHYSTTPILHLLEPDRMPGRFHLDRVENPIRIFRLVFAPRRRREFAPDISLHVVAAAALQFRRRSSSSPDASTIAFTSM